jgi:RHS repeat-associated protein
MQNLRTVIYKKSSSHFGAFSNKCTKGKKLPLKSDTITYLFDFYGKENDNEVQGVGNIYDYGFRIYNPRLGKFLSIDPLTKSYPWYTPYQFAGNTPAQAIDLDGLEEIKMTKVKNEDGSTTAILTITCYDLTKGLRILDANGIEVANLYKKVRERLSEFSFRKDGIYLSSNDKNIIPVGSILVELGQNVTESLNPILCYQLE